MKSLKRVFALAVIFAMVLSSMSFAMAATTFEDVTADDQNVVSTLTGLGIITGYNEDGKMLFKGDQTITRAEFATIICRLIGMGDSAASQRATDFTDVPSTHWASGYVQTAADTNGIINGYGDGTFGPEDNVLYEQAVKMIVCALGYQTKAEEEGTYPSGYIFVAKTNGLTDGIVGSVGQEATRMTVAKLLYNALDCPLMQKILSGTKSAYYGIYNGEDNSPKKTVLSEYLGAVKVSGILANNSISSDSLKEDQVQIEINDNYGSRVVYSNTDYIEGNTITCYEGDTNAKELLGKKVEAYLTYETSSNNDPTVLAIFESTNANKKLSIDFDDIKEMSANGGSYAIKYWTDKDNNKSTTIYVKSGATYYINGNKDAAFTTASLMEKVEDGSFLGHDANVTIDFSLVGKTTGDYDYDYAFISVYENFVVDSVDEIGEKIYAIDDSPAALGNIDFNEDADYELSLVDVKGNKVAPKDLVAYDVLTLKVNPYDFKNMNDIDAIDGILVQDSIEGTVTEINSVDEEYYIDDVAYEIDPAYGAFADIRLDDAGTFYFDAYKNIVAFDQTSSKSSNYAVIIKKGESGGVNDSYQVKMFTAEGAMEVRDFADRVKVNTYVDDKTVSSTKDDDVVYSSIDNAKLPLVCSYKLNSNGEISTISLSDGNTYAATSASSKSSAIVANRVGAGEIIAENRETKSVKVDNATFYMDDKTKVIALDAAKLSSIGSADADDFETYVDSDFTADQSFNQILIADANADRYAKLVILVDDTITLDSENVGLAMVKSINEINDANGDSTKRINAVTAEGAASYTLDADATYDAEPGEVFIPKSSNANNEVKKVQTVTAYNGNGFNLTSDFMKYYAALCEKNSDTTYYFGKVDHKKGNTIYFTNQLKYTKDGFKTVEDETLLVKNTTQVMVYDESRASSNKVSYEGAGYMSYATKSNADGSFDISASDIESYYVLAREYNGEIVDVVYYCYTDDVNVSAPVASSIKAPVEVESVVEDAIIDEIVIVEEPIKEEVIAE